MNTPAKRRHTVQPRIDKRLRPALQLLQVLRTNQLTLEPERPTTQ
jgi:hypothetical protein